MPQENTALKACPSCNALQDEKTEKCPDCGYDFINLEPIIQEDIKPVSKLFYLFSIPGAYIGCRLLYFIAGILAEFNDDRVLISVTILSLLGTALFGYGLINTFRFIYKMWKSIQDGDARTTPKKAVWFLIIPLFNFYWLFQVHWGWTKDYNRYVSKNVIPAPHMPEGIALVMCILTLLSGVPMVSIANFVLVTIFFNKACDGINAIAKAQKIEDMETKIKAGDYNGALSKPKKAKTWFWISFGIVLAFLLLGGLGSIYMPQYSAYKTRAYNSAAVADLRKAVAAQEAYYEANNSYADSMEKLAGNTPDLSLSDGVTIEIISADKDHYNMVAYQFRTDEKFQIIGPNGEVTSYSQ